MRIFHVAGDGFAELATAPEQLPASGYLWVACSRPAFAAELADLQARLRNWTGGELVDLHVSDLLNNQLPSNYDSTSLYDLLVFRRLGTGSADIPQPAPNPGSSIETSPVGFVLFDRLLLSVHPADGQLLQAFVQRLSQQSQVPDHRNSARLPPSAADLMLRMTNHIVDGYLDLRRELAKDLGELQQQLLQPRSRFGNWRMLLDLRNTLHLLEDHCEDQRAAIVEWIDSLDEWSSNLTEAARREHELLQVRSRDVLEHIERVLSHVRRLETSAETAVQMHFSAQSHRTNNIMRTLTVLTAIFLPLNLVTGFFGMNFDRLPLIHSTTGVWVVIGLLVVTGVALSIFFWRKRYIGSTP
ncbi:magnesium transporter CorA family protein [Piscinibacter sakaiensis]|uniref:magnesium transporter CorA family protein n=1 Tax=Piscinibacter sakaiensis TaxID=1547922 RepID=UPI003AAB0BFE